MTYLDRVMVVVAFLVAALVTVGAGLIAVAALPRASRFPL